ncbi:MAG: acyltransferase, partial [Candidatus Competibacter sp.]|nr:acyltransferase [Candidatus Competibacter sp.]
RYGDQWAKSGHDVFQKMYNPDALKVREAAIDEAKQWLQSFVDKKLYIIFEAPKPIFKAPPFRCSDWFNRHNPICVGDNQQPRAEMQRLREPIVTSMYGLTHVFPSVSVWDPFPILCPGDTCFTEKDGRPLFFDGDHLSAYGNMVLYPHFKTYIDALLAESCKKNKAAQRPPCDIAANRDEF